MNLKEINTAETDRQIAGKIAVALTETEPEVFYFSIDHDVRAAAARSGKPKTGACPVEYHWGNKGHVGIDTRSIGMAVHWIIQALMAGYTVFRCDKTRTPSGISYSIGRVRSIAEYHQRPKPDGDDDDIPF